MSGDVHVRFCESAGVRLPRATLLVLLCRREAQAQQALQAVQQWMESAELELHPEKTRIVDLHEAGFDSARSGL